MTNHKTPQFHFRQGIKNIPQICVQHGVNYAVISPGSRNAPLIFAFTAQTEIECLSIADERSAAYFALGLAQQSQKPVALICTSGTAAINYAPAISEAFYQNLPLIVITADRPAEMIDQADGQTIKQENIYANIIKASFQLPVDSSLKVDLEFSDRQMSQAIDTALCFPQGPVHINVPLREPIYSAIPDTHSQPRIIKTIAGQKILHKSELAFLQEKWLQAKRKMVVFGIFPKDEALQKLAEQLAERADTIVLAENLSNIAGDKIITQPEAVFARINSKDKNSDFAPDLLITIGNSLICKQLKIFLRSHRPDMHWQFDATLPYIDTYQSLTTVISASSTHTLSEMPVQQYESRFSAIYLEELQVINKHHKHFVETGGTNSGILSDWHVAESLLKNLRPKSVLHLANSTSVRWTQLFPARAELSYFCNRGTSGIDGSMSTAAGFAYGSKQENIFLTGDLSFIYDSNALWNKHISKNLKIIVMNNQGGNIFKLIGDKNLMKNNIDFFTTPHQVNIQRLTEAFGLNYMTCTELNKLSTSIEKLLNSSSATVLEVFTNSDINTENYKGYFQNIKK